LKNAVIWNISDNNKPFPFDIWRSLKMDIQLLNVDITDYKSIPFSPKDFNLVFLNISTEIWKQIELSFIEYFLQLEEVFMVLIALPINEVPGETELPFKFYYLEHPLKPRELKMIIDKSLKAEFYKKAAIEISQNCQGNFSLFEGVFALAHQEQKNSNETIKAFQSLFDYETKMKQFYKDLDDAIEHVNQFRDKELIELKERIKANEQLEVLREQELKDAIQHKEATERALQFSRIEEIQMDRIIKAQERLFQYNDKEILSLYRENIELKKKLGMPVTEEEDF
jgi:hypothetical protein